MTEPAPPAAPTLEAPPAEPPADPAALDDRPPRRTSERVGTILMIAGVVGIAVLVVDVAMKGRLLAPLFARLPVPKPAAAEVPPAVEQTEADADATPRPGND